MLHYTPIKNRARNYISTIKLPTKMNNAIPKQQIAAFLYSGLFFLDEIKRKTYPVTTRITPKIVKAVIIIYLIVGL